MPRPGRGQASTETGSGLEPGGVRPRPGHGTARWWPHAALFVLLVATYSANLREIPSGDSQPTRFLAAEIAAGGRFTLDATVARYPPLAERAGFQKDLSGHYRSAYPVEPAIAAAVVAWCLSALGLVPLTAPLAAAFAAKLTASLVTAGAVVLASAAAARHAHRATALWVAIGVGLGTNYWATTSQTLWQHDLVAAGLALAVWAAGRSFATMTNAERWAAALGLSIAIAARPQVAVAVGAIGLGMLVAGRRLRQAWWLALPLLAVVLVVSTNLLWFGDPLGAVRRLETLHPAVHGTTASFSATPWMGVAGLLVSPSRGLLVFSPIVLVVVFGLGRGDDTGQARRWCVVAAGLQLLLYGAYSVWWGGYTYGPRYALDVLPLLVPAAAVGVERALRSRAMRVALGAALVWSVLLAGTGAWCYPHERWNTDPANVDREHARLWDWRDAQFVRCWRAGVSPQNFAFIEPGALR